MWQQENVGDERAAEAQGNERLRTTAALSCARAAGSGMHALNTPAARRPCPGGHLVPLEAGGGVEEAVAQRAREADSLLRWRAGNARIAFSCGSR